MNQLGIDWVWSAAQVTLMAVAAAAFYLLAARRAPGAGAPVAAAALGGAVLLLLIALCPLPAWWTWDGAEIPSAQPVREVPSPPASAVPNAIPQHLQPPKAGPLSAEPVGGISPADLWHRFRAGLARAFPNPGHSWPWPAFVALALLTGTGWGVGRLLLGLWAVRLCCRRARPVTDPALLALVDELRVGMACRRPVQVRESAELTTAATVGWRCPVLLLPADWRSWDEGDRRAVLAHELAHVRRGDFLAGLLARLSVALHFYHPLVRWLAGRLHLQQELAADALGADFAGGRGPYLRSLARLALRQEGQTPGWPARTFLPAAGTLLRRVQMLKAKEQTPKRSRPRAARALPVIFLVAVVLGVSALRGPARAADGDGDDPKPSAQPLTGKPDGQCFFAGGFRSQRGFALRSARETKPSPFDLSYVPDDAMGIVAARPAEFFRQPGMKRFAGSWNRWLRQSLKDADMDPDLTVPIEDIEQAILFQKLIYDKKAPHGWRHSLVMGLGVLRTTNDFDWVTHIKKHVAGLVEVKAGKRVYYKVPRPDFKRLMEKEGKGAYLPNPMLTPLASEPCFFVPDARTVVLCPGEAETRRLMERRPAPYPSCVWGKGWKRVENSLLAVALDNVNRPKFEEPEPLSADPGVALFLQSHSRIVFGVQGFRDFRFLGLARTETEQGAEGLSRLLKEGIASGRESMKNQKHDQPPTGPEADLTQFATDFLRQARVERRGREVHFQSRARLDLVKLLDLLDHFLPPEKGK